MIHKIMTAVKKQIIAISVGVALLLTGIICAVCFSLKAVPACAESETVIEIPENALASRLVDYSIGNKALPGGTYKLTGNQEIRQTIYIKSGESVALDLNGFVLKLAAASSGSVFEIAGGTLTVNDSNEGNRTNELASVVDGSTVSFSGGAITGGKAVYGGAINASVDSTVKLNGGTLIGNLANHGGAVFVNSFMNNTINGCRIIGNRAEDSGGGVMVNGRLTMTKGTISGNAARGIALNQHGGGGVKVLQGTFSMGGECDHRRQYCRKRQRRRSVFSRRKRGIKRQRNSFR